MAVNVLLEFLTPSSIFIAVQSVQGTAPEFADYQRLVVHASPCFLIAAFSRAGIPPEIFVAAEHVQIFAECIVNNHGVAVRVGLYRGGNKAARIESSGFCDQSA